MIKAEHEDIRIIIVDDEPEAINSLKLPLLSRGYENIETCLNGSCLLERLEEGKIYLILLDLYMPEMEGDKILEMVMQQPVDAEVIITTGDDSVTKAVELMRGGASDYLVKPIEENKLLSSVKRSAEILKLRRQSETLKQGILSRKLENPEAFERILTQSEKMLDLFRYVEIISPSSQPLLVTGETGVGKELIAQAVHSLSGRSGNYIKVNVAGLEDNMFSDTLFGHFKGAFTGASVKREGLIEKAQGGTILLDEIGSLAPQSQVKLLRLIQEGEYYPLGADMPRSTDVRILASTNHSIDQLKDDPDFRNDLFYRLRTHHVHILPLKDRKEDIPLLMEKFVLEASREMGKEAPTPHPAVMDLLYTYDFPGNLRELRAMVFEAVAHHRSHQLSTEVFQRFIPLDAGGKSVAIENYAPNIFKNAKSLPSVKNAVDMLVQEALSRCNNNQSLAARMLGMTPSAVNKRTKKMKE